MQTIHISIENLIAKANADAMVVSDNTGYRVQFTWDGEWDGYAVKTAVFAWHHKLQTYSATVAFEGDTVAIPRIPAVGKLYVGLTAGNLQTTTPAVIECRHSILSSGGQEPEPPAESEYAGIMELLNRKMEAVTAIAISESEDGTITMVNTLPGRTETIVMTLDEDGNPEGILYNGREIPVSWRAME